MPPVSLLATLLATVLSFVLGGLRGMSLAHQVRPLRRRGRQIVLLGEL
jgi:hypothetical protein